MAVDDVAFRGYLNWKGATAKDAQDTRIQAVRKIEANLQGLNFDYADLDEAYEAQGFQDLREQLTRLRADALAGGEEFRLLLPESKKPQRRLADMRNWLADYGRCLAMRNGAEETALFSAGMEQLRSTFLERMPDFENFDVEDGAFFERETEYKRSASANLLLASLKQDITAEQRGREVYKALSQSSMSSLPLGWRTQSEVAKAPAQIQTRFYEIIARLAALGEDDLSGLEDCARDLEQQHDAGLSNLKRGEVLGIAISVFGTRNAKTACWFKVRTFDRLGKILLGHRLFTSPRFELVDFEEFHDLLERMRSTLDGWGWKPQSLADVQGFIWVALAEDYDVAIKDGLNRKAIEAAMDEFDKIGLEAFLTKYQFGKPRDYWVRRAPDGTLYPAKALVGASYGFLPEGKPQSAKEFSGGYGEQAANGILQKLGFEIVSAKGTRLDVFVSVPPDADEEEEASLPRQSTNLILYGPPGTGKTYRTAYEAVRLCLGTEEFPDSEQGRQRWLGTRDGRKALMEHYDALRDAGRVEFVTFHQSFDYESFVEGLRPTPMEDTTSAGFTLKARPGVFRVICAVAEQARKNGGLPPQAPVIDLSGRQFWKMSLGAKDTEEDFFEAAIKEGYIALGWGGDEDWSDPRFVRTDEIKAHWQSQERQSKEESNWTQTSRFRNVMKPGDIVIVPYGNTAFRAIGEVKGDYTFAADAEGYYAQRRRVEWLLVLEEPLPLETIVKGDFTMRTLYALASDRIHLKAIERLVAQNQPIAQSVGGKEIPQFVLIIDEINRANISKVFGELITLLEPDKRLGADNPLTLQLPYSGDPFGVPANLHIVGTMNTADRSIALLDTALRRRFLFREMEPRPDLLIGKVAWIELPAVLATINRRIEYLIDRERRIGHAFFLGCTSREDIDGVMRDKVIPLLQEYFFEDWNRIHAVLGSGFIAQEKLSPPPGIKGGDRVSWSVRSPFHPNAYKMLLRSGQEEADPEEDHEVSAD